jgi:hypothetical protein
LISLKHNKIELNKMMVLSTLYQKKKAISELPLSLLFT